MAEYIKKCEYCGKEFIAKRYDNRFCCEKCSSKQWREKNKEYKKEYHKQWREQNKERCNEKSKQYYEQNKERCNEKSKQHYEQNKERYKENHKQWREQNKDYHKQWCEQNKDYYKQWREQNKDYHKEYKKTKYKSDLQFKLTTWSRRQVGRCLSSQKTKHTFDILGYTPEQLKQRLEMNFKPDMSWSNHGTLWHIDHRKPLCKFNFVLPDGTPNYKQIRLANSLANLQPLYVTENLSKGGK